VEEARADPLALSCLKYTRFPTLPLFGGTGELYAKSTFPLARTDIPPLVPKSRYVEYTTLVASGVTFITKGAGRPGISLI
jgi:hypothetical protein